MSRLAQVCLAQFSMLAWQMGTDLPPGPCAGIDSVLLAGTVVAHTPTDQAAPTRLSQHHLCLPHCCRPRDWTAPLLAAQAIVAGQHCCCAQRVARGWAPLGLPKHVCWTLNHYYSPTVWCSDSICMFISLQHEQYQHITGTR